MIAETCARRGCIGAWTVREDPAAVNLPQVTLTGWRENALISYSHASLPAGRVAGLEADRREDRPLPGEGSMGASLLRPGRAVCCWRENLLGSPSHQEAAIA